MLKGFIYDPIRHPKSSLDRRNTVINQMVAAKQHYLTAEQAAKLKAKPLISSYSLDINEMKYLSNNYKYTDLVWDGKKSIPANNTFVVPLVDDPSSLNKYGKLLATTFPVRRENINIQPITPRPIQPISPPQQELKPARPNLVPLPESQAQKTWINTVLQKLFK